jgi:hypothetical protein
VNKKQLKMATIAFLAWYVISRPQGAANMVHTTLGGLGNWADSLTQFMSAIPN